MSCTHIRKNNFYHSKFTLQSEGDESKYHRKPFVFVRISWYRELTLIYDLMLAEINDGSPLNQWFSEKEITYMKSCTWKVIAINYKIEDSRSGPIDFKEIFKQNQLTQIPVKEFAQHLRLHPNFDYAIFNKHQVSLLCAKNDNNKITINFPGFKKYIFKKQKP